MSFDGSERGSNVNVDLNSAVGSKARKKIKLHNVRTSGRKIRFRAFYDGAWAFFTF